MPKRSVDHFGNLKPDGPMAQAIREHEEKKIVFETGAQRCDIGQAEYVLIAPGPFYRIANTASGLVVPRLSAVEHVNRSIDNVNLFLSCGLRDEAGSVDTRQLEIAAVNLMYAIDQHFPPIDPVNTIGPAYHRLPGKAIKAAANAWGEGKIKYKSYNWEKGMAADVILNHYFKHMFDWFACDFSEDQLGHGLWNLFTANHSLHAWPELNKGKFRVNGKPPKE